MGKQLTILAFVVLTAAVLMSVGILGMYMNWWSYNYFAPKFAQTQSKVFHNSPEYIHGKIQMLTALEERYVVANPTQKAALRSVIIDEFNQYNGPMPSNLKQFYNKIEQEQMQ